MRKLNRRLAGEVKYLAQRGDTLQRIIGSVYEISQPHVSNIKADRRWPSASATKPRKDGTK